MGSTRLSRLIRRGRSTAAEIDAGSAPILWSRLSFTLVPFPVASSHVTLLRRGDPPRPRRQGAPCATASLDPPGCKHAGGSRNVIRVRAEGSVRLSHAVVRLGSRRKSLAPGVARGPMHLFITILTRCSAIPRRSVHGSRGWSRAKQQSALTPLVVPIPGGSLKFWPSWPVLRLSRDVSRVCSLHCSHALDGRAYPSGLRPLQYLPSRT